jgi:hypothetical protein
MASHRALVYSHHTAAQLWALPLIREPEQVHVTVPRNASRVAIPGTVVHRFDLTTHDIRQVDRDAVTSPMRTVLDLCRVLPSPQAVAILDAALRQRRVFRRRLEDRGAAAHGPGSAGIRRAIALADPRSESFLESVCRIVLTQAGYPPERTQYAVRGRNRQLLGRVDFAWPSRRVVVEVDGFAFHADRQSYRSDRKRLNALEVAGWLVLRFSWEDVVGNPDYVVRTVAAALTGTARAA